MDWYDPASHFFSLGSQASRPGSLAGLHAARREHLSQFFTPPDLARFMWRIVEPVMNQAYTNSGGRNRISLFDNAVGSGRLFQCANPEKHSLAGIDVHQDSIEALISAADNAGFQYDFITSGMEDVHPDMFDVALINPPFSIHLESPHMRPYGCARFGKFGRGTSAVSHLYAVAQALESCLIVAAIIPTSAVSSIKQDSSMSNRLTAVIHLPNTAFKNEGICVNTSIVIFDACEVRGCYEVKVKDLSQPIQNLDLDSSGFGCYATHSLYKCGITDSEPTITLPVTNNADTRLSHNGRYIKLHFNCGLQQAKVMNAIYKSSVSRSNSSVSHRYAKDVHYSGQGLLDIEVWLLQPKPQNAFAHLIAIIKENGGNPIIDSGLVNYVGKRIKQHARQCLPLRHYVEVESGMIQRDSQSITGVARRTFAVDESLWASPIIEQGTSVEFHKLKDNGLPVYRYALNQEQHQLTELEVFERFEITNGAAKAGWELRHEGLREAYPEHALCLTRKATKLGLDKVLSWSDYQFNDLIEACMNPRGSIIGWKMGLGKARLALSLCLMGGQRNMIVVEANLIDEMITEIKTIGLSKDQWQVISKPEHLSSLKKINIISYNRLRMPMRGIGNSRTYAKMLRHRISTLVADEGHLLRNGHTLQSRALWMLSPKKRFILSGTPISNYPRDILPLAAFVYGDGTAAQPYGRYKSLLTANLITGMDFAMRGVDAFREHFVTLEWCTNEFNEDLRQGAKREVPKIKDVEAFRAYVAPLVKRRLHHEPEVAKYISIPKPTMMPVQYAEWDDAHLEHYLMVAREFARWFIAERERCNIQGKKTNLVAVLARIQAVVQACNYPQRSTSGFKALYQSTNKQEVAIARLVELTAAGHKIIFCAHSPETLEFFERELTKYGVDSVLFHGGIPIVQRTKDLNQHFRYGNKPVLLSSYGVVQRGLNIWQADYVYQFERDWSSTAEDQLIHRVLRPQQTREVTVERLHLPGSIDDYQDQMVEFKKVAIGAGLDYGEQTTETVEFLHLDTILGRFCAELDELDKKDNYKKMAA